MQKNAYGPCSPVGRFLSMQETSAPPSCLSCSQDLESEKENNGREQGWAAAVARFTGPSLGGQPPLGLLFIWAG
jgi:hypothetical protein